MANEEMDRWVEVCKAQQPAKDTVLVLVYVKDGITTVDPVMKDFPTRDIPRVVERLDEWFHGIYDKSRENDDGPR